MGSARYNHLFSEKFYTYARAEGLHDGIADFAISHQHRPPVSVITSSRKRTPRWPANSVSSFVTQRLGDEDDNYATLRFAERFEYKFKKFGARVYENVELLPQVNKFENYIVNFEVGVESSITKTISLKLPWWITSIIYRRTDVRKMMFAW
ncbi:MAG: DUF481 domain-containing protein [Limisphaerales bacterium]